MILQSKICFAAARVKTWNLISRSFTGSMNLNERIDNSTNLVLSKKAAKFRILCTDINGKRSSYEISKSTLYHELGLTIRDLRFQHDFMLTARNKNIIIKFQKLKALICPDAILLIDPPFENNELDLPENSVAEFWKTLPALITGPVLYTSSLPLEYKAIEVILTHALCHFSLTLEKLEPEINRLLSILTDPTNLDVDRSLIHILLKNSARLYAFQTEVNEFCNALEDVLEYDEDIRSLCVSTNVDGESRSLYDAFVFSPTEEPKEDETHSKEHFEIRFPRGIHRKYKINLQDEMETLLDSFLKDAEEINHKVKELKEAIENSNTAILINLDSHRNLLLRFELELTIGMFSLTLFGLIGMAFGMNLTSSLEENPMAFWYVSSLMFIGAGLVWRFLLNLLRRTPSNRPSDFLKSIFPKGGDGKPPLNSLKRNGDISPPTSTSNQDGGLFASVAAEVFSKLRKGPLSRDRTEHVTTGSAVKRVENTDDSRILYETWSNKLKPETEDTDLVWKTKLRHVPSVVSNSSCFSFKRMKTLHSGYNVNDFFKRSSNHRNHSSSSPLLHKNDFLFHKTR